MIARLDAAHGEAKCLSRILTSFRRRPESSQVRGAKHTFKVLSASHDEFKLDSGLRRNDVRYQRSMSITAGFARSSSSTASCSG